MFHIAMIFERQTARLIRNKEGVLLPRHRLLDSLVVECWLRVQEVPGSIHSQGPRHTKDVIKWYQLFPCLALNIKKGNTGSFSRIKTEKKM